MIIENVLIPTFYPIWEIYKCLIVLKNDIIIIFLKILIFDIHPKITKLILYSHIHSMLNIINITVFIINYSKSTIKM